MVTVTPRQPGLFTLRQANEMLPLVKLIVDDWIELERDVQLHRIQLKGLQELRSSRGAKPYSEEVAEVEESLHAEQRRLTAFLAELQELGLEVCPAEVGFVGFPAIHQGREVRLCWTAGDSSVRYFYERGQSPADRQLLSGAGQRLGH